MNIIERIMMEEGGYVNDPADAGGETKFGISKRSFPHLDIKNLTREEAKDILVEHYIIEPGFNDLSPGALQDQLIDFGYHSGPSTAIRALQRVVETPVDGILGPRTLAAITSRDAIRVNNELVKKRITFLVDAVVARPANLKFLRGWVKRALSFMVV